MESDVRGLSASTIKRQSSKLTQSLCSSLPLCTKVKQKAVNERDREREREREIKRLGG